MTLTSKKTVIDALKNGGKIEDMTFPIIYSYHNRIDGQLFALFTSPQFDDLKGLDTQYCENVIALMVNGMLTAAGTAFLAQNLYKKE